MEGLQKTPHSRCIYFFLKRFERGSCAERKGHWRAILSQSLLITWKSSLLNIQTCYFSALSFKKYLTWTCCRVCHFHFFELAWPWDLKELCRQFSVGFFFLQKIVYRIFHLPSKGCSYNLQKVWYVSVLHAVAFGVCLRTNVKEATFSGALMRAFCALNRQSIQASSCLSVIFQNQQWLLVVKTWMCTERQTTDSLLWSARKSYLFTVAVIFRIGTVQFELLANCKGEIDFQRWLLCPVCIR